MKARCEFTIEAQIWPHKAFAEKRVWRVHPKLARHRFHQAGWDLDMRFALAIRANTIEDYLSERHPLPDSPLEPHPASRGGQPRA